MIMLKFLVLLMSLLSVNAVEHFEPIPMCTDTDHTATAAGRLSRGDRSQHRRNDESWWTRNADEQISDPEAKWRKTALTTRMEEPDHMDLSDMGSEFQELQTLNNILVRALDERCERARSRFSPFPRLKLYILEPYAENLISFYQTKFVPQKSKSFNDRLVSDIIKGEKEYQTSSVSNHPQDNFLNGNLGDLIVKSLKQTMLIRVDALDEPLLLDQQLCLQWWKYFFKTWDFLIKTQSLSPNTIGEFFSDIRLTHHLVRYSDSFRQTSPDMSLSQSYRFTEHWYWKLSHGFLKDLKEETKNTINSYFLVRRYPINTDSVLLNGVHAQSIAVHNWFSEGYFLNRKDRSLSGSNITLRDVRKIIELIAISDDVVLNPYGPADRQREAITYYCDLLAFINEHVQPKIIAERDATLGFQEEFDKRFKLIHTGAQMFALDKQLLQFQAHIQRESPENWHASRKYQSIFYDYHIEFSSLITQFHDESRRVRDQYSISKNFDRVIQDLYHRFEQVCNAQFKVLAQFRMSEGHKE